MKKSKLSFGRAIGMILIVVGIILLTICICKGTPIGVHVSSSHVSSENHATTTEHSVSEEHVTESAERVNEPSEHVNSSKTEEHTTYTVEHPYESLNDFNKPSIHQITFNHTVWYYVLIMNHHTNKCDTIKGKTPTELFIRITNATYVSVSDSKPLDYSFNFAQKLLIGLTLGVVFLLVVIAITFSKELKKI